LRTPCSCRWPRSRFSSWPASAPRRTSGFVGAVLLHDFLLLPAAAGADRAIRTAVPGAINHVRVPAALSALLLLVFFPLICGRSDRTFQGVSGVAPHGYAERWLLVTAGLFAVSAAAYLLWRRRSA
jgi:hypothetical protein